MVTQMAKVDLSKLDYKELTTLAGDIEKELTKREQDKRKAAIDAVAAAAKEHGFSLQELVGGTGKSGSGKSPQPPKYRHPENPEVSWSGRGRQPGWIRDGLAAGKSLEDFAI